MGCSLFLAAFFATNRFFEVPELQAADAKAEAKLKSEVQTLQANLQSAQTQISNLQGTITQQKNTIADLKTKADAQKQLDKIKNTKYVHTVILKLKSDSDSTEGQSLLDDLPSLSKISTVRGLWYGRPADKATPDFANKDFTVGITVLFDNYDGLKKYLDDPVHKKLADTHLKFFEKPVVYDVLMPASP
jgi:Stress responsive A/B Barrel Domain